MGQLIDRSHTNFEDCDKAIKELEPINSIRYNTGGHCMWHIFRVNKNTVVIVAYFAEVYLEVNTTESDLYKVADKVNDAEDPYFLPI